MAQPEQSAARNKLLRSLVPSEFAMLAPHLSTECIQLRELLVQPGQTIKQCFFVESGIVLVVAVRGKSRIEIGMIGREGLVGAAPVLLADGHSPYERYVLLPGDAFGISVAALKEATETSPRLYRHLLCFVEALLVQVSETAHANAVLDLKSRLARWLLMCGDRMDGDELVCTHESLSTMLGVQRSGLTLAIQSLEGAGLIRARRRHIIIRDRVKLEALTDGCYGFAEAEYRRLVG